MHFRVRAVNVPRRTSDVLLLVATRQMSEWKSIICLLSHKMPVPEIWDGPI